MCVAPCLGAAGQLETRRQTVHHVVTNQGFADDVSAVVVRGLRETEASDIDVALLLKIRLRKQDDRQRNPAGIALMSERRSACSVKSDSLSFTLYWSLSIVMIV